MNNMWYHGTMPINGIPAFSKRVNAGCSMVFKSLFYTGVVVQYKQLEAAKSRVFSLFSTLFLIFKSL